MKRRHLSTALTFFSAGIEWNPPNSYLLPEQRLQSLTLIISMFGKVFELGSIMKQAHEFGGKIHEVNEKLKQVRVSGAAAGGMVSVEMNGLQEVLNCKIDPVLLKQEDAELLEELVVAAVNTAVEESRQQQAATMRSLTENIDISGLSETLGKMISK